MQITLGRRGNIIVALCADILLSFEQYQRLQQCARIQKTDAAFARTDRKSVV